jgi:hypothetical protein
MARTKGSLNKPKTPKTKAKAKPEAAPAAQATASAGSASGSFKKPPKDAVVKLVRRLESMAADARELTGSMGEAVAKAVENQHFDRTALGMVRKLYKMSKSNPHKLALTLPHLLAYIDDLGLHHIADANAGMDMGEGEDDDAPQGQTDQPNPVVGGLRIIPKDDESDVPAAPAAA